MQIKKPNKKKKLLIVTATLAALAVLGGVLLLARAADEPVRETPTEAEKSEANSSQLQDGAARPSNPKASPPPPESADRTTDDVPANPSASMRITSLYQQGDAIRLSATLSGTSAAGTCVASFTHPDSRPVVREFRSNGTGRCGPLTVPANEFTALGRWSLTLRFYNQGQQVADKGNIEIR